jgi:hypothetical protein
VKLSKQIKQWMYAHKNWFVSAFIVLYMIPVILALWPPCVKPQSDCVQPALKSILPVILFLGLEQYFVAYSVVFPIAAPYIQPLIVFDDGSCRLGKRLEMRSSFFWHQLVSNMCAVLFIGTKKCPVAMPRWGDLARFIARSNDSSRHHPVVVWLYAYWATPKKPWVDNGPLLYARRFAFMYVVRQPYPGRESVGSGENGIVIGQ